MTLALLLRKRLLCYALLCSAPGTEKRANLVSVDIVTQVDVGCTGRLLIVGNSRSNACVAWIAPSEDSVGRISYHETWALEALSGV